MARSLSISSRWSAKMRSRWAIWGRQKTLSVISKHVRDDGRKQGNPEYFKILFDPFEATQDIDLMSRRIWNSLCWIPKCADFSDLIKFRVNVGRRRARNIALCLNQGTMCIKLCVKSDAYCSFPYYIELYRQNLKKYLDWCKLRSRNIAPRQEHEGERIVFGWKSWPGAFCFRSTRYHLWEKVDCAMYELRSLIGKGSEIHASWARSSSRWCSRCTSVQSPFRKIPSNRAQPMHLAWNEDT
jgi:hypothetical protein